MRVRGRGTMLAGGSANFQVGGNKIAQKASMKLRHLFDGNKTSRSS